MLLAFAEVGTLSHGRLPLDVSKVTLGWCQSVTQTPHDILVKQCFYYFNWEGWLSYIHWRFYNVEIDKLLLSLPLHLHKVSKVIEPMPSFLVDSISPRSCYSAEEHKRSFCPVICCFAVYHDVPLPHALPSSIQQGDVFMSRDTKEFPPLIWLDSQL